MLLKEGKLFFRPGCRCEGGGFGADNYANFPMLEDVLQQNGIESNNALSASPQVKFCRCMDTLQNFFKGYFGSGDLQVETLIRNSFLVDIDFISDEDYSKNDALIVGSKEML